MIIARAHNFQIIHNGKFIETQMKSNQGNWQFVDCAFHCIHCGICLGCFVKTIIERDPFDNISLGGSLMFCEKSESGLHEYEEEDDE